AAPIVEQRQMRRLNQLIGHAVQRRDDKHQPIPTLALVEHDAQQLGQAHRHADGRSAEFHDERAHRAIPVLSNGKRESSLALRERIRLSNECNETITLAIFCQLFALARGSPIIIKSICLMYRTLRLFYDRTISRKTTHRCWCAFSASRQ